MKGTFPSLTSLSTFTVFNDSNHLHWNLLTLGYGINVTKLLSERVCFDVWWSLSHICLYMCIYLYMYMYHHICIEYDIHPWHYPTTFTNFTTPRGMTIRHHIDHHQGRVASVEQTHYTLEAEHFEPQKIEVWKRMFQTSIWWFLGEPWWIFRWVFIAAYIVMCSWCWPNMFEMILLGKCTFG